MSEFFIRRPIVAMVISILMIIMGLITLSGIPISKYPDITPPMIQVTTTFTGANAVNVEQAVATPIEQQVNGVEEMLYMKSINGSDGSLTLQVSFEVGTDLDNANMLTQNRVSQASAKMPLEVKNFGVTTKKSLVFPLMLVSLSSPNATYDGLFLNNYANINIVDQLKRIRGVGDVFLFGGADYSMRIWLDPDLLTKLDLTVNDVSNAVKKQNAIAPGGKFGAPPTPSGVEYTYTVTLQERLVTEEEFGNIIVKSDEKGSIVRLKDIARLELGLDNYNSTSRLNTKPAASIVVYQIPGSNALEVSEAVQSAMLGLESYFPEDLTYDISLNTTRAISVGIEEIVHTLFEAVALVIIVVFLFLQDWRATLIPLLTVPVSLLGTFIVFPMLGFSVNVLSLLGLVLAIGLVVDDAIVVVEAVMHNIEHGMKPKEATQKAMKEVGGPVVAIALILAAVFVPVAFAGGITGRLYQQFAITIAISVLFSAFNALTLSPALSAIILKPKSESKGLLQRFFNAFNRGFDKFTLGYTGVAGAVAKKSIRSVIIIGFVVGGIFLLNGGIPGGFVPEEDEGYFLINMQLPDAASMERTDEVAQKIEAILGQHEEIQYSTMILGYSLLTTTYSTNTAFVFVSLKPWEERTKTAKQLIAETNMAFRQSITEATAIAFGPPPIEGLGTSAGFTLQLQDRSGNSPEYLDQQAQAFMAEARKRPEIGNIFTLYRSNVPQKRIHIDYDKAEKMGIDLSEITSTVSTYLGSSYVNDFNRFGRQYKVFVQAEGENRLDQDDMASYYVRSKSGEIVPLSTLAQVDDISGPSYTNRFNMYRAAEISGAPKDGYSSADALKALEEVASTMPKEIGMAFSNMSYQEKAAEGTGGTMFLMALVFVFLILAAQYESWTLPFSVLLGVPAAVFGAFLGLWLGGLWSVSYVNNVFAQIGLVMLIGLTAKNAILIVEFAKMLHEEQGKSLYEAALESAKLRLRPILMTSFAFMLGVVPLLTASGAGAEARKVMGMAVFSGTLIATIIGVIVVPGLYVLIENLVKKKKTDPPASATVSPSEPTH
ncbi:multidrug efflux RND transporter permease subunit [Algoriphagus sp. H41]|uniref:Multidrug efflux RND transporter permease subunit n=1 Tax=Algoriphagus oliviformis TaxID=2811231 RepID=A0ABS3C2Y5_9BACT|nr:multidrug efflux RND transporter permease subunit [Algoriphagus oliviformis]MBN7811446.1 multidrug efflux RND transporter permease subunit [Algoriphagus oliviformis]